MKVYEIAVAYRIYPGVSKTPAMFSDSKFNLAEFCLRSFKASLGDVKAKIWAILDGCPREYEELFLKYFAAEDVEFVRLNKAGNAATFEHQIDVLLRQQAAEIVYLAEDDYYYLPGQFRSMMKLLSDAEVDFVSPYDHIDYYTLPMHHHSNLIKFESGRHWRGVGSTCLTFMTTKQTLEKSQQLFRTYSLGFTDCFVWSALTKTQKYKVQISPMWYWQNLRQRPKNPRWYWQHR